VHGEFPAAPAPAAAAAPACRDRFLWPFNATSIWNTPIGDGAVYIPAGIYVDDSGDHGPPVEIHNDEVRGDAGSAPRPVATPAH
jgi:hypothetical protein